MSGKYWDKAWSLVDGCTRVSPGCDHCWLKDMDKRFHPENLVGVSPRLSRLIEPKRRKKPTIYAVWSDLFHEDIFDDFIATAFSNVMAETPHHTYLVLTKRPERMRQFFLGRGIQAGVNVYLGVTAENQEQADKRIPILLQTPAAHRFVSIEPMLSAISIKGYLNLKKPVFDEIGKPIHALGGYTSTRPAIDWVVLGGETGHGARPMHPDWVRSVRDQCQAAGVPFWFKGWGKHKGPWNMSAGRLLDGRKWSEVPW